jgi:hypothetical protein
MMNPNTMRMVIAGNFAVAFAIECASILITEGVQAISATSRNAIIGKLFAIYIPQLAIIVGGICGKLRSPARYHAGSFLTAMTVCTFWNLLLMWGCVRFGAAAFGKQSGGVNDLLNHLQTVSSSGSALVAGVLAYFFSKST